MKFLILLIGLLLLSIGFGLFLYSSGAGVLFGCKFIVLGLYLSVMSMVNDFNEE